MGLLHVLLLSKMNTSFFNVLAINKRKKNHVMLYTDVFGPFCTGEKVVH